MNMSNYTILALMALTATGTALVAGLIHKTIRRERVYIYTTAFAIQALIFVIVWPHQMSRAGTVEADSKYVEVLESGYIDNTAYAIFSTRSGDRIFYYGNAMVVMPRTTELRVVPSSTQP